MVKKKVGLLGGSFNPAHDGHVYVSKKALDLIELDEIWWLVSPQNPLKSEDELWPLDERMAIAEAMVEGQNNIVISDFESLHDTRYTIDTLTLMMEKHPEVAFVWMMGADNLVQFSKWHKWYEIVNIVPIAVFDRDGGDGGALSSEAALFLKDYQLDAEYARELPFRQSPCWCFFSIDRHPGSATKIRKTLENA